MNIVSVRPTLDDMSKGQLQLKLSPVGSMPQYEEAFALMIATSLYVVESGGHEYILVFYRKQKVKVSGEREK